MKTTLEDIAFSDNSDIQSNMTVLYRFDLDNIASKKGWCVKGIGSLAIG